MWHHHAPLHNLTDEPPHLPLYVKCQQLSTSLLVICTHTIHEL
jgi:hypothetical protein